MTPEVNPYDSTIDASMDEVRRQWDSAVKEDDLISASIKSLSSDSDESSSSGKTTAPPFRTIVTNGDEAVTQDLGDFVLGELLGQGGMGLVYRAGQTGLDRDVALKMISSGRADNAETRAKFASEARVTGQLDHPNIVPIYELATKPDGNLFYTMKVVRGESWSKAMRNLSESENIDVLLKVADAVAFAHDRGVIHRDLKPENVMLGDYGEVLLMDWGLSVAICDGTKTERLSKANARAGTPAYMAPEMARVDPKRIGPASDVYLLGGILHEILTGLRPHTGQNSFHCLLSAALNTIQPSKRRDEWMDVALKAMSTKTVDRYTDVKAFQRAIRDCRDHGASLAVSRDAREMLAKAKVLGDYAEYSRSVFGFEEALRLWEGNASAEIGLTMARKAYAEIALDRGDFDLALSQVKLMNAADAGDLTQRSVAGKAERERRRVWAKRMTRVAAVLAGLVILVGAIAYVRVSQEQRIAVAEREKAVDAERVAVAEREKAEGAERVAVDARQELEMAIKQLEVLADPKFLSGAIEKLDAIPTSMRPDVLKQKMYALRTLSELARKPEEITAFIDAFKKLESDAARFGHQELRDNIYRLAGSLRERLPSGHDYRAVQPPVDLVPSDEDEIAAWLGRQGLQVNEKDSRGATLAHRAARDDRVDVLAWLKEQGVDVNVRDNDGSTPMHQAALYGHVAAMAWLKEQSVDVNAKGNNGSTPVHLAARESNFDAMKWLKENGANVNVRDNDDQTPMHEVVVHDSHNRNIIEIMAWLKEQGVDANPRYSNGNTLMHEAAGRGKLEAMKWLKEQGADVNARGIWSSTPMYWAARNGKLEAMKWLKEQGADVNTKVDNGWTPMHLMAVIGNLEAMKWLVDQGADVNAKDNDSWTPMLRSACNGNNTVRIMAWFKEQGADVNAKDNDGQTSMHKVARTGGHSCVEIMAWLMVEGLDVNTKDNDGQTPMHAAAAGGNVAGMAWLKEQNADINSRDGKGHTPLAIARQAGVREGDAAIIQWMRDNGAR